MDDEGLAAIANQAASQVPDGETTPSKNPDATRTLSREESDNVDVAAESGKESLTDQAKAKEELDALEKKLGDL